MGKQPYCVQELLAKTPNKKNCKNKQQSKTTPRFEKMSAQEVRAALEKVFSLMGINLRGRNFFEELVKFADSHNSIAELQTRLLEALFMFYDKVCSLLANAVMVT